MFRMWNVWDVGCWGCEILEMWDVGDVGCSGCGMFGMWDVCKDIGRCFKKCRKLCTDCCKQGYRNESCFITQFYVQRQYRKTK